MAPGLFASLFSTATPSNATEPSSSPPKLAQIQTDIHDDVIDVDAMSDETEEQSPTTFGQDVVMTEALPSAPSSELTHRDVVSIKEAQEVADVDMQLSSPPSSPPPTAPRTPYDSPVPLAGPSSVKMEASSSASGSQSLATDTTAVKLERPTATAPAAVPTSQRTSRRRTMPARLSQVSSLLAGSMLEEELLMLEPSSPSSSAFPNNNTASEPGKSLHADKNATDTTSKQSATATCIFTTSSIVVLTSDSLVLSRAVFPHAASPSRINIKEETDEDSSLPPQNNRTGSLTPRTGKAIPSASTSLVSTLGIRRQQLIETPNFKPRDDTLYMPKTRGLRSEAAEDTTDAAYERRHRKPEAAEKRQRKAEVDRLSRDRQKLLARIDQIKTVEARMLQPIVVARDQVRAEASVADEDKQQLQVEEKSLQERIEDVRKELLTDAYETLKRYDLLLSSSNEAKPSSQAPPSSVPSKAEAATSRASVAVSEEASTRSQSPRLKIRIKGGRATWESADSASPTPKQSSSHDEKSEGSRRMSARQPKQRTESLPTPLTAAAVEAVEDSRRKRRRLSSGHVDENTSQKKDSATHLHGVSTKAREASGAVSPERRTRRRGSPEVGGSYKGKSGTAKSKSQETVEASSSRRPQRAAAAAAAVASARQRRHAERSLSDYDDDDEDEGEEVESTLDQSDGSPLSSRRLNVTTRRTSHMLRRSPIKARDARSPSASSTTSSTSSIASSLGYMYPTVPDTGSLKVSQSLAEIHASDPEASSSPIEPTLDEVDGAKKKLRLVLSRSPSVTGINLDSKKAIAEAVDSDSDKDLSKKDKGRSFGGALTESEAESILAAFLGTTPIGKATKSAPAAQHMETPKQAKTTEAKKATALAAAPSQQAASPSKRRSSRRDTTQSFGEKLPDLLTKTAQFDYSIMGYFRSIDRPGVQKEEKEGRCSEEEL